MSDTRTLLTKITGLRQQLEQVRELSAESAAAGVGTPTDNPDASSRLRELEKQAAAGAEQDRLLDRTLRQLSVETQIGETASLPRQLTARARHLLERGRDLLGQLRGLADELEPPRDRQGPEPPSGYLATVEPLKRSYQETAAMAELALRMIQVFPDSPTAQLRLCEGLEPMLGGIAERLARLNATMAQRRREAARVETLAQLLTDLHAGKAVGPEPFASLADALLEEAGETSPLRFLQAPPEEPARFVAAHSLTVAQVLARLVRLDAELRREPVTPVLAGLLHDAGMLAVPADIMAQPGPLDERQWRTVEAHTRLGGERMRRLLPAAGWLAEAAEQHHERLDGTGYPGGLKGPHLPALVRLLAVCDVYVALCSPRPQRCARDTRTALTDTLLLAERGTLDQYQAERLLQISFYPVGSLVELADGAVGVVVATHGGRRDLLGPARPVLALLTDAEGQALPAPRHVDLAQCETRSIVRSLSPKEGRELLGQRYPELA